MSSQIRCKSRNRLRLSTLGDVEHLAFIRIGEQAHVVMALCPRGLIDREASHLAEVCCTDCCIHVTLLRPSLSRAQLASSSRAHAGPFENALPWQSGTDALKDRSVQLRYRGKVGVLTGRSDCSFCIDVMRLPGGGEAPSDAASEVDGRRSHPGLEGPSGVSTATALLRAGLRDAYAVSGDAALW